jgi:hypothetical protein
MIKLIEKPLIGSIPCSGGAYAVLRRRAEKSSCALPETQEHPTSEPGDRPIQKMNTLDEKLPAGGRFAASNERKLWAGIEASNFVSSSTVPREVHR